MRRLIAPGEPRVDRARRRTRQNQPAAPWGAGRAGRRAELALGRLEQRALAARRASCAAARASARSAAGRSPGRAARACRPWRARRPGPSRRPCGRWSPAGRGGAAGSPPRPWKATLSWPKYSLRSSGMRVVVAHSFAIPFWAATDMRLVERADRRRVDVLHPGEVLEGRAPLQRERQEVGALLDALAAHELAPDQLAGAGLGQQLHAHLLHAGEVAGAADAVGRADDVRDAQRGRQAARRSSRRRSASARRPCPTGC